MYMDNQVRYALDQTPKLITQVSGLQTLEPARQVLDDSLLTDVRRCVMAPLASQIQQNKLLR